MVIKSQTKLGNFEELEEVTDSLNQMIEDLWQLEKRLKCVEDIQTKLK